MVALPGRKPLRRSRNPADPPTTDAVADHDDDDDGGVPHRGCGDSKVWTQLAQSIAHVFAPKQQRQNHKRIHHPMVTKPRRHLLHGCTTLQEHLTKIQAALDAVRDLHGREGLSRLGFTYRWIPCEACGVGEDAVGQDDAAARSTTCRHCAQRLLYQHADADAIPTRITEHNRKDYIADGKMYEAVCRLAQEVAQECLAKVGDLEWKTVEDSTADNQQPPIRVLVSRHTDKDTTVRSQNRLLVICTGRGKVRAGIFSRFALLCTGLEIGTAFHSVQSATISAYYDRIALIDPNVHGEAQGFVTFRKSLSYLQQQHDYSTIDLLLHSASGGHFARTLLENDTANNHYPFRRVVFTDSTHNIQWMKQRPCLAAALQDPSRVLYVRSSSASAPYPAAGTPTPTDPMWRHRFGTIPTVWAGTQHHALTNWSAHTVIWEFFHRNEEHRDHTTKDTSTTDTANG